MRNFRATFPDIYRLLNPLVQFDRAHIKANQSVSQMRGSDASRALLTALSKSSLAAAHQCERSDLLITIRESHGQGHFLSISPTGEACRLALRLFIYSNRAAVFADMCARKTELAVTIKLQRAVYRAIRAVILDGCGAAFYIDPNARTAPHSGRYVLHLSWLASNDRISSSR